MTSVAPADACRAACHRYERKAEHFLAFVTISAALIIHRRLTQG
ncbi:hypothetical protein AB0D78_47180 [Streptomyces avermitilis]